MHLYSSAVYILAPLELLNLYHIDSWGVPYTVSTYLDGRGMILAPLLSVDGICRANHETASNTTDIAEGRANTIAFATRVVSSPNDSEPNDVFL